MPRVRIFTRKKRTLDTDNPASYNRGYFEVNFDLPSDEKADRERETDTPKNG